MLLRRAYYSIGGGFVREEDEMRDGTAPPAPRRALPFPFRRRDGRDGGALEPDDRADEGSQRARRRHRAGHRARRHRRGDERDGRARAGGRGRAAGRPRRAAQGEGAAPAAAGRTLAQPALADARIRLALPLRHRRQRGECGRRARRDRAHQRRRRRGAGRAALRARLHARHGARGRPRLPAHGRGRGRHHQVQRLDLRRRGRLPGRGRLGLGDGGGGHGGADGRHAGPESRTPPRSRSSIISA